MLMFALGFVFFLIISYYISKSNYEYKSMAVGLFAALSLLFLYLYVFYEKVGEDYARGLLSITDQNVKEYKALMKANYEIIPIFTNNLPIMGAALAGILLYFILERYIKFRGTQKEGL